MATGPGEGTRSNPGLRHILNSLLFGFQPTNLSDESFFQDVSDDSPAAS